MRFLHNNAAKINFLTYDNFSSEKKNNHTKISSEKKIMTPNIHLLSLIWLMGNPVKLYTNSLSSVTDYHLYFFVLLTFSLEFDK